MFILDTPGSRIFWLAQTSCMDDLLDHSAASVVRNCLEASMVFRMKRICNSDMG